MSLHAHLMLLLLLATVLTPLLGTLPLRGWRWDRQCWWLLGLLSFGMPLAMGHRFARILLPGVGALFSAVLLAGLDAALRAERQGESAPSLWWLWLARAFAGAGLWVGLALGHVAVSVQGNGKMLDSATRLDCPASWLDLLGVTAAVALLIHVLGWRDGRLYGKGPSSLSTAVRRSGTVRLRRCLGAGVLFGILAAALALPWLRLHAVGPHVLGYLGFDGFAAVTPISDREAAKPVLAALASATLLFWAFQALWNHPWRTGERSR